MYILHLKWYNKNIPNKEELKMTREEYYELLKKKHAETDWNNLESIKRYNEYARMLRQLLEDRS